MEHENITCDTCGTPKNWMRFRLRVGDGTTKEVSTCSDCRAKAQRAASYKKIYTKKRNDKKLVLIRTTQKTRVENGYACYDPKLERQLKAYCKKKTAMDRKYLRDNQDKPLSLKPYLAQKQQAARDHAQGWIGFYDDLCNHAINLLRQTGTRPPWALMEGKFDLQQLHGIYNTKRAQLLRAKG